MLNFIYMFSAQSLIILCLCACANRQLQPNSCIDEKQASAVFEKIIAINRTMSENEQQKNALPKLTENSCRKQKYSLGNRFIILYLGTNNVLNAKTTTKNDSGCLSRALSQLKKLSSVFPQNIVNAHKQKFNSYWTDVDLGPDGWLKCSSTDAEFNESLDTFLHELVHELRDDLKQCLFIGTEKSYLCFELDASLPLRSYAARDSFPTERSEAQQGLLKVQENYLTAMDGSFFLLLDELNAYTVSSLTSAALNKTIGPNALIPSNGKRPSIFLPLFLNYSSRYLGRLKYEKPDLFKSSFIKNLRNKNALEKLLGIAEKSYKSRRIQMKSIGDKERDWEAKLFAEYYSEIRKLGFRPLTDNNNSI